MNIIKRIRQSYITKGLALTLAFNLLGQIIVPTMAMALTSGPSQPEFQSFEPVETTDMVNLFTGDFTYNIPLMNVPGPNGGYPINLAYHANPTMDEEASWVGLGWSLNAGAINRHVRGLPDDFDGDEIVTKTDMKENWTVGLGVSPCLEVFGADNTEGCSLGDVGTLNLGLNFRYNSYKGFGYSLNPSLGISGDQMNYQIGLSLDSEDGIGVNAGIVLKKKIDDDVYTYDIKNYVGAGFNSKRGVDISTSRSTNISYYEKTVRGYDQIKQKEFRYIGAASRSDALNNVQRFTESIDYRLKSGGFASSSSSISFSESSHYLSSSLPLNTYRLGVNIGSGISNLGLFNKAKFSGNFDIQDLRNKGENVIHEGFGYEHMYDDSQEKNVINDFSRTNQGDVRKTTPNLAIPQITHDVYGILGQGIGGSFRAYRNEVGRIYDPHETSFIGGGYINVDAGGFKAGWGAGGTLGYSEQQAWDNHHELDNLNFSQPLPLYRQTGVEAPIVQKEEPVIYKVTGEKTTLEASELDYVGGEGAINGEISGTGTVWNYGVKLPQNEDAGIPDITNNRNVDSRIARNNLVHKVTNQEILDYHPGFDLGRSYTQTNPGNSFLGEFEIFYYNWDDGAMNQSENPNQYLDRKTRGGSSVTHHNGGYKVLDNSGSYYVYGLPVYNTKQVEKVFSVNATKSVDPTILSPTDDGYDEETHGAAYTAATKIFENKQAIIPFETEGTGDDEDVIYKHANTQKFYNKKETPAYATSYLLTSILGTDYVDTDGNGPDDGDLGYWVKLDYVKYTDNYKWRAPYQGALYSSGSAATLEDDVASYQYGEKELWYVSRIETETHIAIFELEETRTDNHEAIDEYANINAALGVDEKSGLRLSKIKLYEKEVYEDDPINATPIQTVHFTTTFRLCKNAENHSDTRGKLTLTGVHITYGGNSRGALNPYTFHYSDINPDYGFERYDRWGNYKGEPSTDIDLATNEINQELPYTGQYQQGAWGLEPDGSVTPLDNTNRDAFQEEQNENVSAWSLTEINLPSGGTIKVDYEVDDYAYVQDKRATQMAYITGINDNSSNNNELYRWKGADPDNDFGDPRQRRIYFKLEEPISTTAGYSDADLSDIIFERYVRDIKKDESGTRNLYFRSFMQLKDAAWDYVSGYLPLEENEYHTWIDKDEVAGTPAYTYGASNTQSIDGDTKYTEGFVTVQPAHKKNDPSKDYYSDFHPMALAAWQYIRINAPQIMADAGEFGTGEIANTDKGKAKKVKNLFSFLPELAKMFTGYRRYCFNREMARFILLNKSMIRLTTPDRKKIGGGSRVKQIELSDNWDNFEDTEAEETYGVVYDYTTIDPETGEEYSSGVAQYEPMIGGDELATRYPKHYPGKIPFFTDNNLFFENPVNESYMPAPVVGYSKVTIRSLNTVNQMRNADLLSLSDEEKGRGVTGAQVYEFYTAKDFPVIIEDTPMGTENNTIKSFNVPIIIPFIAQYKRNKIAATQGYKIELNDMHGKVKSTSNYGVDKDFNLLAEPLNKTTYKYSAHEIVLDIGGTEIIGPNVLDNKVAVLSKDPVTGDFTEEEKYVGMEYEFFTDQRHNKHATLSVGLNFNLDLVMIPFVGSVPIPSVWGHLNSSKNDVRTFVTNKIIRKSGLLEEVINVNESYRSSVKTLKYDATSGRPLLTVTKNEFQDEIYSFSHPAHWEYDGMGHAYQNINLEFYAQLDRISSQELFGGSVPTEIIEDLEPGDEFIARIRPQGSEDDFQNYRATFISKNYGGGASDVIIHVDNATYTEEGGTSDYDTGLEGYFKVYRSGHRNHFMTDAGSVTAMVNPVDSDNLTDVSETYNSVTGEIALPSTQTITVDYKKLSEKVLSANAITFRDNWEIEKGSNENPYQVGQAGIWRSVKSYVYAGERSQSSDGGIKSPRVQDDGMMSDVPMFNWQVADIERFQEDWEWSGELTRLNKFGYETETKDRLGIYSAALYGYSHALPIGVGGNATYQELATQDFELFNPTDGSSAILNKADDLELESNFYFHNDEAATGTRNVVHNDNYKIVGGKVGVDNFVYLEGEYTSGYWSVIDDIDLAVYTSNNDGSQNYRVLRAEVVSASAAAISGCVGCPYTKVEIEFEHETISPSETAIYLNDSDHLGGIATVYRSVTTPPINVDGSTTLSIGSEGHTGKQSLKIEDGNVTFSHAKLQLIPGKRYVFSYWAKRDDSNVYDYDLGDTGLEIYVAGTTTDIIIPAETKTSNVVEGWQKIDVEFEIDAGTYSENQAIDTKFFPGSDELYIDDIRLSPKTGGIMTYVYDPLTFKLVAVLNANNFATFYYYGDQGNLYLTKQETQEGIVTSAGSHGHTRTSLVE